MNGIFYLFSRTLVLLLFMPSLIYGQTSYLENFDEADFWSGGSSGSYNAKMYINPELPDEDQFYSDECVRESSNVNTGYAWRLRNSGSPFFIYECEENIESFSVFMAHWNVDVSMELSIEYSTNSGASYSFLESIDETWWTDQGYLDKEFKQYFSGTLNLTPLQGEKIYLKIASNGNERLLIDDFQLNYNNGSTGPQNPVSFAAVAVSENQIDLIFAPNNSNDDVVIAFNESGLFVDPYGPPPSAGQLFSGGTLLYVGLDSPQNHTGQIANQTIYYKAWSYDGDSYSGGILGNATTTGPTIIPNAWINEIHYDNDGGDLDELIEIVIENPDNIDLESLVVSLYNGSNGEIYASETVNNFEEGISINGYTLYTWFYNGIQNGAPEGIALAIGDILIPGQFLSYEGTFEATEGPANGLSSADIEVEEPSSNPIGYSLQLSGSGLNYTHFIWQDPADDTPGNLNNLQEFDNVTSWTGGLSSSWLVDENWDHGIPSSTTKAFIPVVDINSAYYPVISELSEAANVIIDESATLEIEGTGSFTVHESFVNNGTFLIHSDETGTGSYIGPSEVETHVERFLSEGQWHFLSSPVNVIVSDLFEGLYLMEWDEPLETWNFIEEMGVALNSGMYGYSVWADVPTTINFNGHLNSEDQQIEVTYTEGTANPENDPSGYNLIGNPFSSSIDWDLEDGEGWSRTNVAMAIYYWNGTQYASYVKDGPNPGTNGGTNIIPPHQGFYIKCTSTDGGSISVNNSARLHSNQDFYKNGEKNEDIIRIQVRGNEMQDEIILHLDQFASFGFDEQFDTYKLFGCDESPQLYTITNDSIKLALNTFPFVQSQMSIPIGFMSGLESGICELNLTELNGYDNIPIWLEDRKEDIFINLRQEIGYKFISEPGDDIFRFRLRFFDSDMPATQNLSSCETINFYTGNGKISMISGFPITAKIIVSDIYGREILTSHVDNARKVDIDIPGLSGLFIMSVVNGDKKYSRKVFLTE